MVMAIATITITALSFIPTQSTASSLLNDGFDVRNTASDTAYVGRRFCTRLSGDGDEMGMAMAVAMAMVMAMAMGMRMRMAVGMAMEMAMGMAIMMAMGLTDDCICSGWQCFCNQHH